MKKNPDSLLHKHLESRPKDRDDQEKKNLSDENVLIQLNRMLDEPGELALCEANSQVA